MNVSELGILIQYFFFMFFKQSFCFPLCITHLSFFSCRKPSSIHWYCYSSYGTQALDLFVTSTDQTMRNTDGDMFYLTSLVSFQPKSLSQTECGTSSNKWNCWNSDLLFMLQDGVTLQAPSPWIEAVNTRDFINLNLIIVELFPLWNWE